MCVVALLITIADFSLILLSSKSVTDLYCSGAFLLEATG